MTDLITVPSAKLSLGIPASVTTWDADLAGYVAAATKVIEHMVGPVIAGARTKTLNGGGVLLLPHAIAAVTSVTVNGTALADTDYTADLGSGIIYAGSQSSPSSFASGVQNVTVLYTAGATATVDDVPSNIALAARELVRYWWQLGQQGNRPAYDGSTPVDDIDVPSGFARVYKLLGPDRAGRMPGFA